MMTPSGGSISSGSRLSATRATACTYQIGLPILVIYVMPTLGVWRRLALLHAHPTAFFRECSAEMGDAELRAECAAGCDRVSSFRLWPSHFADWACGRRASGIFRKPFYVAFRPISFRAVASVVEWRHGGSGGWNADRGIVGHILQWTGSYMIPFLLLRPLT